MRGEHQAIARAALSYFGSPPRAWGASESAVLQVVDVRFTPTCVGSMQASLTVSPSSSVHPHVRGEHSFVNSSDILDAGSPPRAWGAFWLPSRTLGTSRFTPTCVGSMAASSFFSADGSVHPHVRGEHHEVPLAKANQGGSPPRAWGACSCSLEQIFIVRFTPTCVGSIVANRFNCKKFAVHPHVRGEHAVPAGRLDSPAGSPPRAWGA